MPKRILTYSRTEPARTILGLVAVLTLLAGLFLFTPWYTPIGLTTPVVSMAFHVAIWVAGAINTLAAIPAVLAMRHGNPKALATGSFWLFLWYLFVTFARIFMNDPTALTWVTTLIIAIVMGVCYIYFRHLTWGGDKK